VETRSPALIVLLSPPSLSLFCHYFFFCRVILIYFARHLQNYNYLVKIKGHLISKEYLSIVMEFMDGGSLFDVIHKKGNAQWSMLQKVFPRA